MNGKVKIRRNGKAMAVAGLRIRTKLTIAFLFLAILPMSIFAYNNITQSKKELIELAGVELTTHSKSVSFYIEQLLLENQMNSATLAGTPLVVEFLSASENDRKRLLPKINELLKNFEVNHPDYNTPGLLDAKGIVQASLAKVLVGKDRSFRDYFTASIKGTPYISDILVGRATRKPGIFLTHPVRKKQGEIVGIDIVWLKADSIWRIIDQIKVGKEGVGYLIDQDGVIIAHPDRDLLYHSLSELTPLAVTTISKTFRFGTIKGTKLPRVPKSLGIDKLAAQILMAKEPGTIRYFSPIDNQYHVAGYTPVKTQNWTVVVDLPEPQFMAPLNRMKAMAYLSIGLLAIIAATISVLLSKSITRPIRNLTAVAVDIKSDKPFDPDTIVDVTSGKDEIAYLGQVFSSMVISLQKSEEKYRILVENSPDLSYRTDLEGKIIFVSHSVYALSGYTVDEAIGMKMAEEIYADADERALLLSGLQQHGFVNNFEAKLKRKDGSFWWASTNAHFYKDKDGNILGVEGITRDVTERRMAENDLRTSEAKFRSIFENSPLALVHFDSNGVITICNDNLCKLLGSKKEALIGFSPIESLKDQKMKAAISTAISGKKGNYEGDYVSITGNRSAPIRARFAPVLSSDGNLNGVIGILEDITEQRRTQEVIIQTEKMLSVGGLAAGMAHEINNPLAGILQNAEVVINRVSKDLPANHKVADAINIPMEKIFEYMGKRDILSLLTAIRESGKRAAAIVKNMLSFSRKGGSHFSYCTIATLLDDTLELAGSDYDLKKKYDFRKIEIVKEYQDTGLEIKCEESKIQQVFLNIFKNGAQAMAEEKSKKTPRFVIRTYNIDRMACIEIEDNGPGMDEQIRKRVFEPFFTTKGIGVGTGLGMSVSYFIIKENHEGSMVVESVPGQGATFIIHLPLQKNPILDAGKFIGL
ncbi:MAG: PAS domain S-box protein, partial [Desulfobacula sp.]|nr:PAS domain S-box protein [Desulfobacula sp.]